MDVLYRVDSVQTHVTSLLQFLLRPGAGLSHVDCLPTLDGQARCHGSFGTINLNHSSGYTSSMCNEVIILVGTRPGYGGS